MIRTGFGYDVHKLVEGRKLILCGVEIPYTSGLLGHSDADVALHALSDALLGSMALGDIGLHFPDTSDKFKDVDSRILLREVVKLLYDKNVDINNIDITIVAQSPKLMSYIPPMRQNIADDLEIDISRVSVKATTTERLGFEGRSEGISAYAVATVNDNMAL